MQQLAFFIRRYKYSLYFFLLFVIGFGLTINNHSFHRSKLISTANGLTGNLYSQTSNISHYFSLKGQNKVLVTENTQLKNELENLKQYHKEKLLSQGIDSSISKSNFTFISGEIIKNEYANPYNFITINKGKKHGVTKELGVINSKGIIGITENTSKSYSRVQSIINGNTQINAKFKNNHHYGSLTWNGKNYNILQLTDIPRQADYQEGDTIVTGGRSSIFPEGIPIGTVLKKSETKSAFNTVDVVLFNDMSNLKNIYIIKNFDIEEIKSLEN